MRADNQDGPLPMVSFLGKRRAESRARRQRLYFDDGSAADLAAAVATMVRYELGVTLSTSDLDALVLFLQSLTGTYEGRPLD